MEEFKAGFSWPHSPCFRPGKLLRVFAHGAAPFAAAAARSATAHAAGEMLFSGAVCREGMTRQHSRATALASVLGSKPVP